MDATTGPSTHQSTHSSSQTSPPWLWRFQARGSFDNRFGTQHFPCVCRCRSVSWNGLPSNSGLVGFTCPTLWLPGWDLFEIMTHMNMTHMCHDISLKSLTAQVRSVCLLRCSIPWLHYCQRWCMPSSSTLWILWPRMLLTTCGNLQPSMTQVSPCMARQSKGMIWIWMKQISTPVWAPYSCPMRFSQLLSFLTPRILSWWPQCVQHFGCQLVLAHLRTDVSFWYTLRPDLLLETNSVALPSKEDIRKSWFFCEWLPQFIREYGTMRAQMRPTFSIIVWVGWIWSVPRFGQEQGRQNWLMSIIFRSSLERNLACIHWHHVTRTLAWVRIRKQYIKPFGFIYTL